MAKGDKKRFNAQESQQFGQGSQAFNWGLGQAQSLVPDVQSKYEAEYNSPGYTDSEKQAMRNATSLSTAGAYGDAGTQLANRVAATGNSAGFAAGMEELGREKARDMALGSADLEGQFANARIQGQQNAARGLEGLVPMTTGIMNSGAGLESAALNQQGANARQPGWGSQLLGNIEQTAMSAALPGKASGGYVRPGESARVGEGGEEMIQALPGGGIRVVPASHQEFALALYRSALRRARAM